MRTIRAAQFFAPFTSRRLLAVAILAGFASPSFGAEVSGCKLNASVRKIVQEHCGSCHDGSLASAKPAALKVFDLRENDWTARMSDEQIHMLNGRGESLEPDDRAMLAKFVTQTLKRRTSQAVAR